MLSQKIEDLITIFSKLYPEPGTALKHNTPFELLIATILSAQTTDKQVNRVTAELFKEYNKPQELARINRNILEEKINSLGLYHNKSKYLIETSKMILNKFGGKVPASRSKLMKLPGVGRKTANVVLACAFTRNAFPVDTHVFRVSRRLGIAGGEDVKKVEKELMDVIPEDKWTEMHHWLILHGRNTCKARNPHCRKCDVRVLCKYNKKTKRE